MLTLPPLSLYVHLPWCVRKCPYCDFNSHTAPENIPEQEYIDTLIADLDALLPQVWNRPVHAIFFGGGTPSLFSGASLDRLLSAVRGRLTLSPDLEVTLEANPGTVEYDHFATYVDAGINRVSLGVQSFNDQHLQQLGRIHSSTEAVTAIEQIRRAGIDNLNIDLMFALPGQSLAQALDDVNRAIAQQPEHLSHYQLTLEPNTAFAANPPELPEHDDSVDMQLACAEQLQSAGYSQYEISAWSQPDQQCRHNLNYWQFGDYLAIGAGAHGKITLPAEQSVLRYARHRHPKLYLQAAQTGNWNAEQRTLEPYELLFEYFLNHLRLNRTINLQHFNQRTGLGTAFAQPAITEAVNKELLMHSGQALHITELGWRFVNDLQAIFLRNP